MTSFTQRVIGAAKLDAHIYEEVEADTTAMGQAMGVVALSSVAAGIGAVGEGMPGLFGGLVAAFLGWFVWAGLTYFIGTRILPTPQTHADWGELLRTTGFAAAPGIQGRVVRTQSGSCDIRPTILDYLGLRPPSRTHGAEDPSRPMFAERERGAEHFQRLIRTAEWKYVYSSDGRSQLYHLAQDPGETKNLARDPDFEAIQTRLRARLRRWVEETSDTRVLSDS